MQDIRITRWAHTLVHYCLSVKSGETVAIFSTSLAQPLIAAVYQEILRLGAHPVPVISLPSLSEIFLREANDEQLSRPPLVTESIIEKIDARLAIMAEENTRELSGASPEKMRLSDLAQRNLRETWLKRTQEGKLRWALTLYPTQAFAQDANMSLHDFEEFVFNACFLNDSDTIACWRELSVQQQHCVDWLVGHKKVRILGDGTDLALSIDGRTFINSDGKRNFPSGEFFTSPVEDSAKGVIRFTIPSSFNGRSVEDIRLVFRDGRVVEASATQGQDYLEQMLDMDAGSRYLGEFAFGNNSRIKRGTRNILFDEKIGGTVHLALGSCYPETGGRNQSALHWDMICDLRTEGEVWIDDVLFLKDGKVLM
jgi:aminopeptidase